MKRLLTIPVFLASLMTIGHAAAEQASAVSQRVAPLPRELEIQLALSALPPHLRDQAAVYVLNPATGLELARKGTNGFHTFVARTGADLVRGTWVFNAYRDDILYPISFDAAGANANMKVFFDIEEMRAKGTPPAELKKIMQDRYQTGRYKAPAQSGVSYMLAPILRNYVDPDQGDEVETSNNPHVMYYTPTATNADIGGVAPKDNNPYPFVIMPGPHGYTVQHFGKVETEAITSEYRAMLASLCQIKSVWCLPGT